MRYPTLKIIAIAIVLAGIVFLTIRQLARDNNGTNTAGTNQNVNIGFSNPSPGLLLGVTPSKGSAAGGTEVKFTGENFIGTPKILFGTTEAKDVKIVSKTEITAKTPAGIKGKKVDITLKAVDAPTSTLVEGFTYQ